jgi:O-antigen/teichoic acid export membrane protein
MKAFAAGQAFRVTVILICCFSVAALGLPGPALGASFSVAEILLTPVLILILRPPIWGFAAGGRGRVWVEDHLRFGLKALVNGFLVESYVRVDIIMLGIFVSDHAVGIYSFAALFIEGLYQVPVVVRTIANPVLVRLLVSTERTALVRFCRRTAGLGFAAFAAAAGAVVVAYPYLAPFFPEGLVTGSHPLLMILAAGLAVYSVFIPLDYILLQAGQPGRQSLLMTANVFVNVALNLALIPFYGIWGAAVATALAFTISSLNLNLAAWRWLGLRGGVLLGGAGPALPNSLDSGGRH